jgi:hypothetical protein
MIGHDHGWSDLFATTLLLDAEETPGRRTDTPSSRRVRSDLYDVIFMTSSLSFDFGAIFRARTTLSEKSHSIIIEQ